MRPPCAPPRATTASAQVSPANSDAQTGAAPLPLHRQSHVAGACSFTASASASPCSAAPHSASGCATASALLRCGGDDGRGCARPHRAAASLLRSTSTVAVHPSHQLADVVIACRVRVRVRALVHAAFTTAPRSVDVSGYNSQVCAILGAQWGDEGKGKLVDILAKKSVHTRDRDEENVRPAATGVACTEGAVE